MSFKNPFASVVIFVSLCLAAAAHAAPSDGIPAIPKPKLPTQVKDAPLSPEQVGQIVAKPGSIKATLRALTPAQQLAAARQVIEHVRQMKLEGKDRQRVLATMTAACLAAVDPAQRVRMARLCVRSVNQKPDDVLTIVAAIALAAGTGKESRDVVAAAVDESQRSLAMKGYGFKVEFAAASPDVILGSDVAEEVVSTVQVVAAFNSAPRDEAQTPPSGLARKEPLLMPPVPPLVPPHASPYEAQ